MLTPSSPDRFLSRRRPLRLTREVNVHDAGPGRWKWTRGCPALFRNSGQLPLCELYDYGGCALRRGERFVKRSAGLCTLLPRPWATLSLSRPTTVVCRIVFRAVMFRSQLRPVRRLLGSWRCSSLRHFSAFTRPSSPRNRSLCP